ncbi:hypothetical protein NMY22_g9869 [Coprinellus aureogranulatus]|nr:hypothetical protein NMY22_g9869 [Coprinellus aureogranulatus]
MGAVQRAFCPQRIRRVRYLGFGHVNSGSTIILETRLANLGLSFRRQLLQLRPSSPSLSHRALAFELRPSSFSSSPLAHRAFGFSLNVSTSVRRKNGVDDPNATRRRSRFGRERVRVKARWGVEGCAYSAEVPRLVRVRVELQVVAVRLALYVPSPFLLSFPPFPFLLSSPSLAPLRSHTSLDVLTLYNLTQPSQDMAPRPPPPTPTQDPEAAHDVLCKGETSEVGR